MVGQTTSTMIALNADVVGYSRQVAEHQEAVTNAMRRLRQQVMSAVNDANGTLFNFVGDNFMAIFDDAESGISAAISITRTLEDKSATGDGDIALQLRIGLDSGEVTKTEDDYFGDPLNIAARIQALARPGGISISGRVYRELDEPSLRFRSIGPRRLKNIPENVDVYEMVGLPSSGAAPRGGSLDLDTPIIGVLPIHKDYAGESREFADLIRSDMIHRLAQIPELRVIEASTEPEAPLATGARYMLETGVHEFGDTVRVFATIFDVNTWNIVKSHKRTVPSSELLVVSEELADEVGRSVEIELIVGEPAGLYEELDDPVAIGKVYLGWYHLRSDTEEGWAKAIDLFGEVAASHPEQPFGHVLSAFTNWTGAVNGWGTDPTELLDEAVGCANKGIEVGDPTGMGQAVLAATLMWQGREDEALTLIDDLKILRPTCDVTYGLEGSVRRYLGDWQRSVDLMNVAMRLTGLNKPWYPTVQACSLFMGGQLEQAAGVAEEVLSYQPSNLEALLVLTAAQVELGMDRSAVATATLIRERFPGTDVVDWLERHPYQDRAIVERWKQDLETAGAI